MKLTNLKITSLKAFFSGVVLFIASDAFAVNLVTNGSFEDSVISANGGLWEVYSSVSGWQTPLNYIEIQSNGLYGNAAQNLAPNGTKWAELDAVKAGTAIRQKIATENGATYNLSFFYSERPYYGFQEMGVYWNNNLVAVVGSALTVSTTNLNWRQYNFNLLGNGTEGILSFASLNNYTGPNDAGGNLLDHVMLTKTGSTNVPEPATMILLSSGLIAGARLRRKAQ